MSTDHEENAADRDLGARAMQIEPPPLDADTLSRVAARRASGERRDLPTVDLPRVRRFARGPVLALAAAAASVIVAISLNGRSRTTGDGAARVSSAMLSPVDSSCGSYRDATDTSALGHLADAAFGVAVACGAEPVPSPPVFVDGSQITAATLVYEGRSVTDRAFTSVHQQSSYTIERRVQNGVPALVATRTGPLITRVSVDTLTVSMRDLIPLHWVSWYVTQRPVGMLRADFDSSSVSFTLTGRVDTAGRFPYTQAPGRLPWEWTKILVIPALRLAPGWHGTIQLAAPYHPHVHREFTQSWATISLRVIGRETISVPAGTFDCWKLESGPSNDGTLMWVSVHEHFVVRSRAVTRFGDTEFDDTSSLVRVDTRQK